MNALAPKSTTENQQPKPDRKRSPSLDELSDQTSASSDSAFIDNRPAALAQKALQAMADQSPQSQRLLELQSMGDNSPRVKAHAQLRAAIDNSPQQVAQRQQWVRLFGQPGQRLGLDDGESVQGKFTTIQTPTQLQGNATQPSHGTGIPSHLKAGIEYLSGMSMDGVQVHYNSSKPAQLNALAYTKGQDIQVGPGQEHHLPHEAWHVAQQMQGRVKPTTQAKGVAINDDEQLEREADVMGAKAAVHQETAAVQRKQLQAARRVSRSNRGTQEMPVQGRFDEKLGTPKKIRERIKASIDPLPSNFDEQFDALRDSPETTYNSDAEIIEAIVRSHEPTGVAESKATDSPTQSPPSELGSSADIKSDNVTSCAFSNVDWNNFGALTLHHVTVTDDVLSFVAQVCGNPAYMFKAGDQVKVVLHSKAGRQVLLADLTMAKSQNCATLQASFTFQDINKHFGLDLKGKPTRTEVSEVCPELGVLATWLPEGKTGGELHRSGGIDRKNGDGLIPIRGKVTLEDFVATEPIRNTAWNEAGPMIPGRPVFDRHQKLLTMPGGISNEMMTTLEAESEYYVEKSKLDEILKSLAALKGSDLPYGILEVEGPIEKHYEDTYYDFDNDTDTNHPLLSSGIVFRRRSVPAKDKKGTNLIAIKGRTKVQETKSDETNDPEKIRLAAQVQMAFDPSNPKSRELIANFLSENLTTKKTYGTTKSQPAPGADNAMAHVLRDALKEHGLEGLLTPDLKVKKALQIHSKRTQYKFKLNGATVIDFSADEATGFVESDKSTTCTVFSIEFGVGHPGLTAAGTGSSSDLGEVDPEMEEVEAMKESQVKSSRQIDLGQKRRGLIHRPYHVPRDLDLPRLFESEDAKKFRALRDKMMEELFKIKRADRKVGGNKAQLLAQMLGIIPKPGQE